MKKTALILFPVAVLLSACEIDLTGTPPGDDGGDDNFAPTAVITAPYDVEVPGEVELDGSNSYDFNGDPLSYLWTLTDKPAGSAAELSNATKVKPTFFADVGGTYEVTLVVSDAHLNSRPDAERLVAFDPRQPPVANAGSDQRVTIGAAVNLDGTSSYDVNGDDLSYSWQQLSGEPVALTNADGTAPAFVTTAAGQLRFELTVTDVTGSGTDTVDVDVSAPPTADAGDDRGVVTDTNVTLDGWRSIDPDGDPITFDWSFVSRPAGSVADFDDPTLVQPTFPPDVSGTYVVSLIVNDGLEDSPTVTTTVTASYAPVADAGPNNQYAPIAQVVTLDGSGSTDPDPGDQLTYEWQLTVPDASTAVLSDPNAVQPTFTADQPFDYYAVLTVSDGVTSSFDYVRIYVSAVPMARAGPDKTYATGAEVTLDGSESFNPWWTPLTYAWSFASTPIGSGAVLSDPAAIDPTFVADVSGTYVLELVVSTTLDSDPAAVTITAREPVATTRALPDSGQDACFDAAGAVVPCTGDGQDGDIQGPPINLSNHLNGTVTDEVTDLMWQRCTVGQGPLLCAGDATVFNGYQAAGEEEPTYNPAGASFVDPCGDLSLGGHDDWRLPNALELVSIMNYSFLAPAFTPSLNPIHFPASERNYWPAVPDPFWPGRGWVVDTWGGVVTTADREIDWGHVRCVRGEPLRPSFLDLGDGRILDESTGLEWAQDAGPIMVWASALTHCSDLSLAGHDDWRLPNVKEARALVTTHELTGSGGSVFTALDARYFPDAFTVGRVVWTSTTLGTSLVYGAYYLNQTSEGGLWWLDKDDSLYPRCVR